MKKAIMFQGTASNVGKSILTAGFCRIFLEDGYSVAPFKAQNMALNSFVTEDGLEMGRAQVTQAHACRIKPDVHMNPVLLKPNTDTGSQVVVMGTPAGNMNVRSYVDFKKQLKTVVRDAYQYMESRYDIIVIEGAGSPAEINLKKDDITNMHVAKLAQCPVIIVGDIDRGGVYAHFAGTYDLLDKDEQDLTAGFLINKFRGDASLLKPANDFIQQRTGKPIFGVVPMVKDLRLPDEDSVEFKKRVGRQKTLSADKIHIAVVDLPHVSNFTDFDPFEVDETDVQLFVTDTPEDLLQADIIMIPGSKNTLWDMKYLRERGFPPMLETCISRGKMVIGICGGYQMLGKRIIDPEAVESSKREVDGLGILALETVMAEEKRLTQVTASCMDNGLTVTGYEIHHGRSYMEETPLLMGPKNEILGCRNTEGNVWGTYIHGVFDDPQFRNHILDRIRKQKNLPPRKLQWTGANESLDSELTRLASVLRETVDIDAIYKLLE
jgi:adenosylcobyric acid synthase